ncbi:MAG: hypothetical protein VKN33_00580 [Candidatus Sericytochromatia bacterium]|nr:hypothetical protein [Candidatus Sericytochromatia bacterium]
MHRPSSNEAIWFREQELRRQQDGVDAASHRREVLERKLLGEYLIEKGYMSASQLDFALQRQQFLALGGRRVLLGELLVEMSLVRPAHIQEALTLQQLNGVPAQAV